MILALNLIFIAGNVNAIHYGYGYGYNSGGYVYAAYRPYVYYRTVNPFIYDRTLNFLENTDPLFFNRGVTYRAFDSIDYFGANRYSYW